MKRYARQCDITKEGMDEGWIWYGGTFYTKYEKDTVQELHKDFDDEWGSKDWSDDKILEYAFEADIIKIFSEVVFGYLHDDIRAPHVDSS